MPLKGFEPLTPSLGRKCSIRAELQGPIYKIENLHIKNLWKTNKKELEGLIRVGWFF